MQPVSPVMPGSEAIEVVLGKNQPEYVSLPAVYLDTEARPMITRWRLSHEERVAIAAGADIVLTQLTFGNLFQPVHIQVTEQEAMPLLLGD
jgi:hypothetical protein